MSASPSTRPRSIAPPAVRIDDAESEFNGPSKEASACPSDWRRRPGKGPEAMRRHKLLLHNTLRLFKFALPRVKTLAQRQKWQGRLVMATDTSCFGSRGAAGLK